MRSGRETPSGADVESSAEALDVAGVTPGSEAISRTRRSTVAEATPESESDCGARRSTVAEATPESESDCGARRSTTDSTGPRRAPRRPTLVNGRVLRSNWREQSPAKGAARARMAQWAARYPAVGEIAGELRAGEVREVFWRRPKEQVDGLWARRPSRDRVRRILLERRVLIAGVLAVAVLATADAHVHQSPDHRPLAPGEALHVAIAYPPQLPPNPQSVTRMLDAIAAGEKRREAHVVAAAARATLERAKAEAAAAASGEWQDWMGQRAPVVPGALVPGSTPSVGGFSLPAKGAFTSGFGSRWGTMHRGIDIAGPIGSPIYAVADGTVIEAGPAQGFGLWVRIRHDDGTISIYGHMYDFFVSQGERVPAGMQIARIGNRGDSTGPHLHFEIVQNGQHVDPQAWLAMHGLRLD
ncbi:M23 family metallopeptidase [Nocardia lasii]|uniref:M23 family metallopeptidase n=1 Tax=Nocardia lasii TaxID=1616107 RepID=A0ABW1JLB2_9NOCA